MYTLSLKGGNAEGIFVLLALVQMASPVVSLIVRPVFMAAKPTP